MCVYGSDVGGPLEEKTNSDMASKTFNAVERIDLKRYIIKIEAPFKITKNKKPLSIKKERKKVVYYYHFDSSEDLFQFVKNFNGIYISLIEPSKESLSEIMPVRSIIEVLDKKIDIYVKKEYVGLCKGKKKWKEKILSKKYKKSVMIKQGYLLRQCGIIGKNVLVEILGDSERALHRLIMSIDVYASLVHFEWLKDRVVAIENRFFGGLVAEYLIHPNLVGSFIDIAKQVN